MADIAFPPFDRTRHNGRTFFSEPNVLAYLSFTEAWERFSYYGMTAVLVLYMSQALYFPGHVEHIAGFAAALGMGVGVRAMSTVAVASQVYVLYTGFVYFHSGVGWADRRSPPRPRARGGHRRGAHKRRSHCNGVRCIVPHRARVAHHGMRPAQRGTSRRGSVRRTPKMMGTAALSFSIFSIGINVGSVAGPLVCALLGQRYGWLVGFGLADVLMFIGLAAYLADYHTLVEPAPSAVRTEAHASENSNNGRIIVTLIAVTALTVFRSIAYYQNSNISLVGIDQHVDLDLPGLHVPVAWFNSIDPFISIAFVPILIVLWNWQDSKGGEPGESSRSLPARR
jgi:POT family proton-dependent oligopeptide transporter